MVHPMRRMPEDLVRLPIADFAPARDGASASMADLALSAETVQERCTVLSCTEIEYFAVLDSGGTALDLERARRRHWRRPRGTLTARKG